MMRALGTEERPERAMLELLRSYGVDSVGSRVWVQRNRLRDLGFQYLAVEMLVKELSLAWDREYRGEVVYEKRLRGGNYKILLGPGNERADASLVPRSRAAETVFTWRHLEELLPNPPKPVIVVDMGMKFMHTEEELGKLRLQISVSLGVVRRYLWDPHLALTSVDPQTAQWLNEVLGENKVTMVQGKPSELLWSMDADKVVILRPDAAQPLTGADVLTADAFLIGGIVDRIPRPGISRMLDNLVPWGVPRKIELRGSVVGVPERINRIIEIILKARYEYAGDVERAIISSMTKKDVVSRAYIEILRHGRRENGQLVVSWDLYWSLKRWLPIDPESFRVAAARARARIVGEPPSEDEDSGG